MVWFAAASLLCGLAPDVETLVAARALQGVGGALLTPGSLALCRRRSPAEDRARAIGAWSGLGGVAAAVGPFLGGWLVDAASWRWVFLINVPLAPRCVVMRCGTCRRAATPTRRATSTCRRGRSARSASAASPTASSRAASGVVARGRS